MNVTPSKEQQVNGLNNSQASNASPENEAAKQKLLEAKLARKKVEEDAQLLANRIALLEVEDKKAQKKIEETRKKAQEIMDLKARNKETEKQKQEFKKQKEEEIKKKNLQVKQSNEEIKTNQDATKASLLKKIKSDVDEVRKIKKETKEQVSMIKDEDTLRNTQTVQIIKNKEKELELKKQKALEDKRTKAKKEYDEKIASELQRRLDKEEEIKRLEQREMELIQKLQNTQNVQKQAFEELEKALTANLEDQGNNTTISANGNENSGKKKK